MQFSNLLCLLLKGNPILFDPDAACSVHTTRHLGPIMGWFRRVSQGQYQRNQKNLKNSLGREKYKTVHKSRA